MSDNDYNSKDDEMSECSSCGKEQELGTFNIIDYVDGIQKTYCDKCYKNHINDEGDHYPFYEEPIQNKELSIIQYLKNFSCISLIVFLTYTICFE